MSRSRKILNNVLDKKSGFSDDLKNKIIDRAVTFVKKQETVGQKEDWRKISEYRKSKEGTKDLKKDSTISHEEARPTSKSYHSSDTDEIFTQEDLKDAFDARDEILKNSADVKKGIKKSIPHIFHNIYFTSKDNPKEIKDSDVEIIKNNVLKTMLAFPDREYILWTNDNNIQDTIRNIEGLRIENIYGISDNDLNSELSEKIVSEDFGMASDILRAVLIKKYGGTYLDLDYAIYNYSLLRDFINSYTLILGKDSLGKEYFGNAFIAASPNHSVLINYVNKIKNNLSMPDPKDKSNACVVEKWDGVPVVLGKVGKLQLVKIQPTQSLTDSVEPNLTYEEVTNHAKLRGGMYWVVTKVKEVSSEIYDIVEADILWAMEGRIHNYAMVSNYGSTGILDHDTIQDGIYLNLGDPLHSYESEYLETSSKKQGLRKDAMEVGLTHSTLSMGKPYTWGRGQQYSVSLSTLNSLIHGG